MIFKTPARKLEANRRYRQRNPEAIAYHKRNSRLRRLGLQPADLIRMLDEQAHRCAICGVGPLLPAGRAALSAHVDHCHNCGDVRSILCKRCNVLLGFIESDEATFFRALTYYFDHYVVTGRHERAS